MYIRNLDPHPPIDVKFDALKKDGSYWFPHKCKYFTWFIIVSVVVSACVVLIMYGISFGMIKTYLWLTAFSSSLLMSIFIVTPIRIMIFNIIDALFFKGIPFVVKRQILVSDLTNPPDPVRKEEILKYRKYNSNLYQPTPLYKLQSRTEDIKYNLELRNLTVDIITYVVFMATVFYIVLINKTPMGFYSNEMVLDLFVKGNYTHSISFEDVNTYDMFIRYLKETFLPALLPKNQDSTDNDNKKNRSRRSWIDLDVPQPISLKKRRILEDYINLEADKENRIFHKGWTLNPSLKLLGKPRLRQVRVKTGTCKRPLNVDARNEECASELSLLNVDRSDYTLFWTPAQPKGLTKMQEAPWKYASALETATVPIFGKFAIYPPGGYVLELARNDKDAKIVIDFMEAFQWIDIRTRGLFIEFTVYSVNTNLFNVVTLVAEKSATGYIVPSYKVDTSKFIFLANDLRYMTVIMSILFAILLFFFMLRESLRIHRTSFKVYITRAFAVLDLAVIVLGAISLTFLILRSIYVAKLLKKLEESNNNEFVSFIYAASWHSWSVHIEALLICLASFKLFRLLNFRVVFFQLQTTLGHCYRHFIDLTIQQSIIIIAFAFFFNLTLLNFSQVFCNFGTSFSTMIGRAVALDDTFDYSIFNKSSWYLAPFFFGFFVILVNILFVNLFIAIICLYFHKIRNVPLTNKYNICDYVRYFLTVQRQRDILHLKDNLPKRKPHSSYTPLRLRGGGGDWSKLFVKGKVKEKTVKKDKKIGRFKRKKKVKPNKKVEIELEDEEDEITEIMMKDFVTRKPYDHTDYRDLDKIRDVTMRNIAASFLADDEEEKENYRITALMGLFISFTTEPREMETSGKFFFVVDKSNKEVYDSSRFPQMQKIVQEFGKKKHWFVDENIEDEISQCEEKLSALNKKLSLLVKKR